MHVRQLLNLKPARSVSDKYPVPVGTLLRGTFDQLLIDQPRLHRAKVTQTRPRNLRNFSSDFDRSFVYASPVIVIDALFKQVRSFNTSRCFGKKFSAGIENEI